MTNRLLYLGLKYEQGSLGIPHWIVHGTTLVHRELRLQENMSTVGENTFLCMCVNAQTHATCTANIMHMQFNRVMCVLQSWPDAFQTADHLAVAKLRSPCDLFTPHFIMGPRLKCQACLSWTFSEVTSSCISLPQGFAHTPPFSGNSLYPTARVAAAEVLR